ncbi:TCP-1/cpn60 chaperonin family protein [Prunus dulcis]|uniref:TCP-1/cpn60 chaperonin family protein n=1 Tax=Prunus dulcis TaxID=3755 RepID=A0A5H2XNN0_PRUDU|nr:TCP-1/cpn60 chaperonin family protein [Prunus dulcis]
MRLREIAVFTMERCTKRLASNPDKVRSEYKSFSGSPNLAQMHIIMAKPAGGPSERDQHAGMDED